MKREDAVASEGSTSRKLGWKCLNSLPASACVRQESTLGGHVGSEQDITIGITKVRQTLHSALSIVTAMLPSNAIAEDADKGYLVKEAIEAGTIVFNRLQPQTLGHALQYILVHKVLE